MNCSSRRENTWDEEVMQVCLIFIVGVLTERDSFNEKFEIPAYHFNSTLVRLAVATIVTPYFLCQFQFHIGAINGQGSTAVLYLF